MVVVDRAYGGAAAQTTLQTAMTPTTPGGGGTISVADDSGYPASGKFEIVIDRGQNNEESILISSRSGTTFTIGQRAYDGTVATQHDSGVSLVEHELSGVTVQKFVDHVDDVESDPHSTKLLNNTRHDVEARHTFGAAYGTPVTPTALTPDIAGAAGTGNNPAREDHVHNVPAAVVGNIQPDDVAAEGAAASFARSDHTHGITAAAPSTIGTANSEGAATSFARSDHVHASATAVTVQVFTSSGTWNKPAGLKAVRVRLVGGGGGSGGVAATAGSSATGGGGGGGGYAEEIIAAGSLGATETVTIGAGGSAGAAGDNDGGNGGTTSFGAHCQATGGGGGDGSAAGTDLVTGGGTAGVGSGGSVNMSGSEGGCGLVASGISIRNGDGGMSLLGAVRFCNSTGNSVGEAGNNYGGGAAGAVNGAGQAARAGAAGAAGIVIVEEYV